MEDYHTKLEISLREYRKLRSVYENLEEYENEYMVPIVHHLRYYYGEFKKKMIYQMERLSLKIRKLLTSGPHYNRLKYVNKEIICGMKQHLFRRKCKQQKIQDKFNILKDRYIPSDIKRHICSFLMNRDVISIEIADLILGKEQYSMVLKKMTKSAIIALPNILSVPDFLLFDYANKSPYHQDMRSHIKSRSKQRLIDGIIWSIDHISRYFKDLAISDEVIQGYQESSPILNSYSKETVREYVGLNKSQIPLFGNIYSNSSYKYIRSEVAHEYMQILKTLSLCYDELSHKNTQKNTQKKKKNNQSSNTL